MGGRLHNLVLIVNAASLASEEEAAAGWRDIRGCHAG